MTPIGTFLPQPEHDILESDAFPELTLSYIQPNANVLDLLQEPHIFIFLFVFWKVLEVVIQHIHKVKSPTEVREAANSGIIHIPYQAPNQEFW